MEIRHIQRETKGFFKAVEDNTDAGNLAYTRAGEDQIIINHTEVYPAFNGKGVGKMLVMAAVNYARENHIKIIPLCPFAKAFFDKTPEIKDVLS